MDPQEAMHRYKYDAAGNPNGNPGGTTFTMTPDFLTPINLNAVYPQVDAAYTNEAIINQIAANYAARPNIAPGAAFFRNRVLPAAPNNLTANLEPEREIYTIYDGERVLLKHIPEDTMMFTYFKYPKKADIIQLFQDAEAAGRPFTQAELFKVKLDFLRARLNYEFTVTEIRRDFGDGFAWMEFCFKTSNNDINYYYSTPGLGHGVFDNYNLCLTKRLNRNAKLINLKYNYEGPADLIEYHSGDYNPDRPPRGRRRERAGVFTASMRRDCSGRDGADYDISVVREFAIANEIDGITTLKEEDAYGYVDVPNNYRNNGAGRMIPYLQRLYGISNQVAGWGGGWEPNPEQRTNLRLAMSLMVASMETDVKMPRPLLAAQSVIGPAEYCFHPLGRNIYTLWDTQILPTVHHAGPDENREFRDGTLYRRLLRRDEIKADITTRKVYIKITNTQTVAGFEAWYNRLYEGFLQYFRDYMIFKDFKYCTQFGVAPDAEIFFYRGVNQDLPQADVITYAQKNILITRLTNSIMERSIKTTPNIGYDIVKRLLIANANTRFKIPRQNFFMIQPFLTLFGHQIEKILIKGIIDFGSTLNLTNVESSKRIFNSFLYRLLAQHTRTLLMTAAAPGVEPPRPALEWEGGAQFLALVVNTQLGMITPTFEIAQFFSLKGGAEGFIPYMTHCINIIKTIFNVGNFNDITFGDTTANINATVTSYENSVVRAPLVLQFFPRNPVQGGMLINNKNKNATVPVKIAKNNTSAPTKTTSTTNNKKVNTTNANRSSNSTKKEQIPSRANPENIVPMNPKVWSIIGETINTMYKIEHNIEQKNKKNIKNNRSLNTQNRNNTRKNTKNSFVKNNSILRKRGRNNTLKNPRKNPRSISI